MNKKYMLLLLALLPMTLAAQSPWSLKTCIEYGLKNNRSNAVYANEKKIADARAKEALAAYLPVVSVNSTLDNNLKVQQTVIPAGIFGPNDLRVAFTKKFNTNHVARLDQVLFDQSLIIGLKANKYSVQQAALNERGNREEIIYNISSAYANIFVYREQLSLFQTNLQNYQAQQGIIALQVKKGTVLQKNLDKVTVDYNNTISQLSVSRANLVLAENQLKYEMGYPMEKTLLIDSVSAANVFNRLPALMEENTTFLACNRVDYRLAEVNAKLLEIDQASVKGGALPKLTAYAQYGAIGFGDQVGPAFSSLSPYSAIGLKLNIPIFDFFKRNAQYSQAKFKRLNALENLKIDQDRYALAYQNARIKVLNEQNNLDNNKRNILLAQSVFDTTNLQFGKGTTDLTDWLNAQNSLKEAQNNYLVSLYAFFQARVEVEKAAGTLTTFYNSLSSANEN
jgi:outer membrane protein